MRQIILVALVGFCFSLVACNAEGKSANEREYDSLTAIIKPRLPYFRKSILTLPPPEGSDSALTMWDDLEHLSYPEMKEKYNLKDSVSERQFLDAIAITAGLAAKQREIENMIETISE